MTNERYESMYVADATELCDKCNMIRRQAKDCVTISLLAHDLIEDKKTPTLTCMDQATYHLYLEQSEALRHEYTQLIKRLPTDVEQALKTLWQGQVEDKIQATALYVTTIAQDIKELRS